MSSSGPRRTVGRYELIRPIGTGGMAVVHLARQTGLDRLVAIKELRHFDAHDVDKARQFLREARLAGMLAHPNVVTVHEYFEHEGVPYISMEYLRRGSLRPLAHKLPLEQTIGVLEDVLEGLKAAAAAIPPGAVEPGIVHRDLKPENLMVTDQGMVKIADFGIAKAANRVATGTESFQSVAGATVGTPQYMAPEQAMAQKVTGATDLYSLGVIAYELLVGRVPFDDESQLAVVLHQANDPVPPPRAIKPDLDRGLADWVTWLLAKNPQHRPDSPATAAVALREHANRLLGPRRSTALPEAPAGNADPPEPPPDGAQTHRTFHRRNGADASAGTGGSQPQPSGEDGEDRLRQGSDHQQPQPPGNSSADTVRPRDFNSGLSADDAPPPRPAGRPWRWVAMIALSAALAAATAVVVRQFTEHAGKSADNSPRTDLKRLTVGRHDYTIDPPPGWRCADRPCKEGRVPGVNAFSLRFVRGPDKVSLIRYPLAADSSGQHLDPRIPFERAVRESLLADNDGRRVTVDGHDSRLGATPTWEYSARVKDHFAAGITFVAERNNSRRNGYWIGGNGSSGAAIQREVHEFASAVTPLGG